MKQNKDSFSNLGFSSIIIVLAMICLITFATLSVLTAHTDYQLSQKTADNATSYYTADAVARKALSDIDSALFTLYKNTATSSDFYGQILSSEFKKALPLTVSNITIEQTETLPVISYEVPISEMQTLCVSLKIQYPQTDSECFSTIIRWQTIDTNE